MKKVNSLLQMLVAAFLIVVSSLLGLANSRVEAASAWWSPNISAQQAAELYCSNPAHAGLGESAVIPLEGITLSNTQWTPVVLRGVGCATPGSRSVGFSGIDYSNGNAPVDYTQSGLENVTSHSVTDADNVQLPGDEVWMHDNGVVPASGALGNDITLRINLNLYPNSGTYNISLHGVTWYIDASCPTPLQFSDIGATGCTTPPNKTNSLSIPYSVTIDALVPDGGVDDTADTQPTASNIGQSCSSVSGWAIDQDSPSSKLSIHVYVNTAQAGQPEQLTEIYTTTADGARSDQYNGHGFSIPQEVLNQHVSLQSPTNTLIIRAVGIVQNGSAVGEGEDTQIGTAKISACLPKAPDTGDSKSPIIIGLTLFGGFLCGLFILRRKSKAS